MENTALKDAPKHKLVVEVEVSADDLACVLSTALEGGINYWTDGSEVGIVGEWKPGAEYASDHVALGGAITIREDVGDGVKEHTLDAEKLLKGLALAVKQGHVVLTEDDEWVGNVDATVADNVVQLALFGEILFG